MTEAYDASMTGSKVIEQELKQGVTDRQRYEADMKKQPNPRRVHAVKSWVHFFQAIKRGDKTHDLRKDDRGYAVGDQLLLQEYDPFTGKYTGDELYVWVTFITDRVTPCAFSGAVLDPGYAILSIQRNWSPK